MFFWSNNGRGDNIQVEDVAAALPRYDEPPCSIVLITNRGKIIWDYSSVQTRDKDLEELKKLREQFPYKK